MSFPSRSCPALILLAATTFTPYASTAARGASEDRIQPYAKNPYYWQYKGKPVLLLGGSVDDNLFQIPNLVEQLDLLRSVGGNYLRNTMSSRDPGNVWPFAKLGDKYDLERWNEEYWRRFEKFLAETARRDIIVQIEIWATFDYYRENWRDKNPFNPGNNITYTAKQSGLPLRVGSHPTRTENDFFRSVPGAKNLSVVLKYQRRFVEKILSHTLGYDHVLYCMDNETSVTPKWGAYWASVVRQIADQAGKQVETTEMWDPWDLGHRMHSATFDHPEYYSFIDISQNNHQKGQRHYDNAVKRRLSIQRKPRPLTNVKIYGADTGRFGNTSDAVERFWRNIFGGHAAARFHRPPSGLGLSKLAGRMIRSAREVTDTLDIFTSAPQEELLHDREPNEAYCLSAAGRQYAVYFPRTGEVTLETRSAKRQLSIRWYDIDHSRWLPARTTCVGGRPSLRTPGSGQWIAVIR